MSPHALLYLLLFIIAIVALGWAAFWFIRESVPANMQQPARFIVGIVCIIIIVMVMLNYLPNSLPG